MMVHKWFLLAAGGALLAGCSSHEEPPPPEPSQGKVRVEVKQHPGQGAETPPPAFSEQRPPAPEKRRAKDAAPPEPPPSPNRAAMQRTISGQKAPASPKSQSRSSFFMPGNDRDRQPAGLEGELNEVERSYVRGVRERNARTEEATERQVFGGFLPERR